jgi:hypothetical protein
MITHSSPGHPFTFTPYSALEKAAKRRYSSPAVMQLIHPKDSESETNLDSPYRIALSKAIEYAKAAEKLQLKKLTIIDTGERQAFFSNPFQQYLSVCTSQAQTITFSENQSYDDKEKLKFSVGERNTSTLGSMYSVIKLARLHIGMCDPYRDVEENVEKCVGLLLELYANEDFRREIMQDDFLTFNHHEHGLSQAISQITIRNTMEQQTTLKEIRACFLYLNQIIESYPVEQREEIVQEHITSLISRLRKKTLGLNSISVLLPITQCAIIKRIEAIEGIRKAKFSNSTPLLTAQDMYGLLYCNGKSILGRKLTTEEHSQVKDKLYRLKAIQIDLMANKIIQDLTTLKNNGCHLNDYSVVIQVRDCVDALFSRLQRSIKTPHQTPLTNIYISVVTFS